MKSIPEFKVVFVGDSAVGKTSIIQRYYNGQYSAERPSTIGAAFVSKEVKTQSGEANLQIWDTAGQERYRSLVPMYSRGAAVAIVVYDVSEKDSFIGVEEWVNCVREDAANNCKIILVGNKIDLPFQVPQEESDRWAADHELEVIYVSAKTGENIENLFDLTAETLPTDMFQTPIALPPENNDKKKCC